jgi:hypothetical protein
MKSTNKIGETGIKTLADYLSKCQHLLHLVCDFEY